jgi:hypothetical protein
MQKFSKPTFEIIIKYKIEIIILSFLGF